MYAIPVLIIMRLLIICPLKREFQSCRSALSLKDNYRYSGIKGIEGLCGDIEVIALKSGFGKNRAEKATEKGIRFFSPDLVLDTGSCAGIGRELSKGTIVFAEKSIGYTLTGSGREIELIEGKTLCSAYGELPEERRHSREMSLQKIAKRNNYKVEIGIQASGDVLINSTLKRRLIAGELGAAAGNCETLAVFSGSRNHHTPVLSFRIITDRGDEKAVGDFWLNLTRESIRLYRFLGCLLKEGWLEFFSRI